MRGDVVTWITLMVSMRSVQIASLIKTKDDIMEQRQWWVLYLIITTLKRLYF
jgi:hypothetical protein